MKYGVRQAQRVTIRLLATVRPRWAGGRQCAGAGRPHGVTPGGGSDAPVQCRRCRPRERPASAARRAHDCQAHANQRSIASGRLSDRIWGALSGHCQAIAVQPDEVDEGLERRRERAESGRPRWLEHIIVDHAALNVQQPRKVRCSMVTAGELGPDVEQGRQPLPAVVSGIEGIPVALNRDDDDDVAPVFRTSNVWPLA